MGRNLAIHYKVAATSGNKGEDNLCPYPKRTVVNLTKISYVWHEYFWRKRWA
uniref:Uncharacterized protein n=1 Tax=Arundo donax TaxID=35708 RepID=A0A0A9BUW3_ARUDO